MTPEVREAEALINASLIQRPDMLDEIQLSHQDFFDSQFGTIFRIVEWLYEQGKQVSTITVMEKLAKRDEIDSEHKQTAADITIAQPWAVKDMARIIREGSIRRKAINAAQKLLQTASEAERIDDNTIDEFQKAVDSISDLSASSAEGPQHISNWIVGYEETMNERLKSKNKKRGASTGVLKLDYMISGFVPKKLNIVAARPSMGKTAFMLHAAQACSENDYAIVYSVEMDTDSLLDRLSAAESNVDMFDIVNGRLKKESQEWTDFVNGLALLELRNMFIDQNAGATVGYIRSSTRRTLRKIPPDKKVTVFVDYLQLVKTAEKGRSRHEEIAEISQQLKAMAKELNVAVVALAQLNRNVDQRAIKRPEMADIRDSGQIEQDADVIMFLYRDEYYNKDTKEPNILEIIVAKNRNGETGSTKVGYNKEKQKIINPPGGASHGAPG